MNLNGDFEVEDKEGQDVIPVTEPDLPINPENQPVDPADPSVEIVPAEEPTEEEVLSEFPEVTEDLAGITALEEAFQDLEYVTDDIAQMGGICQVIATEADKCIPGFLNEDRPLGYFTKAPSATHLRTALEAIDAKKAGIITAIFAAILAAIYKVYEWFKKHKESKQADAQGEAIQTSADDIAEKYETVDRVIDGGLGRILKEAADKGKPASKRLVYEFDGILYDLLKNNSVLIAKMDSVFNDNGGARGFGILVQNLTAALDSIAETAKKQIGSSKMVDAVEAEAQIKKLMEGNHPSGSDALGTLKYEGKYRPINEIVQDLNGTLGSLSQQTKRINDLSFIADNLGKIVRSKLVSELTAMNNINAEATSQLISKIQEIEKIVTSGKIETESRITESPNYKGQKELISAVKQISNIAMNMAALTSVSYKILIIQPQKCLKLLETCYHEAQVYLRELKAEYEKDGKAEANADEIARIEKFLEAFKA